MSEQEKIEAYNALIVVEREKSIRIEPVNFTSEETIWIPKSQFQIESLEIEPWLLEKLGFDTIPLRLQLPEGGWSAVEKQYTIKQSGKEGEARQEEERAALEGPGSGATVHDDNPANEKLEDRDGEKHIMTLNEKLTEIKVEAIEDGLDAIEEQKIARSVKTFACIWKHIREDNTFQRLTEIQRGYAASAIYKKHRSETDEVPPQEDDANVVKVYKIPYMGGGIETDGDDNEEGHEDIPETG